MRRTSVLGLGTFLLAIFAAVAAPGISLAEDSKPLLTRGSGTLGVVGVSGVSIDLNKPATQRYAIVIGNGAYQFAPALPNAVSDARLVASVLKRNGYIVQEYENIDKLGFEAALRRMMFDTTKGSEVVIYYAGHGVQIGNSNRLIPVDAAIRSVYDLPFETVSLSSVLAIAGARSRSLVVILDSCRDNPFPQRDAIVGLDAIPQELSTGFAAQDSPVNSLIVFSTSPGAVALDGSGGNSPFTKALYDAAMATPDMPLNELLQEVRRRVYSVTKGLQVPWESSSMVEQVVLDDGNKDQSGNAHPVDPASLSKGMNPVPISITLPLDRSVQVGAALKASDPSGASAAVTELPADGRLELNEGGGYRGLLPMSPISGGLGDLVYSNIRPEASALAMQSPQLSDSFEVAVNGQTRKVDLNLNVDPCDFNAGDHLDPEGVGVARYPNEIEVKPALAACEAAVAREPKNGRFRYELGRVHLALGDLDAAEADFTAARDLGHTRAWQALGLLMIQREQASGGAKRTIASAKARELLAQGVDRGDPYAFHTLGLQLLEFSNDPIQKRAGFDLLMRALEVGHTFSMNELGAYFLQKDSDHYDPERGLRYFKESAARGDIYGYDNMGHVTLTGVGSLKADPAAALEWFKKASAQGHPTAPSSIGRMYFSGALGGKPDYPEAVKWDDLGLSRGDAWGGANAAWIIAQQKLKGFTYADAAVRAAKASALHNAEARKSAMALLSGMPAKVLDAAAQDMMREIGETVPDETGFGAGSQAAPKRIADASGSKIPDDPTERLVELASIYWTHQKFRVDLY